MKKYRFNKEIQNQVEGFGSYLRELGNAETTTQQKCNYVGFFLKWLETGNIKPTGVNYNDMVGFIDHCRKGGDGRQLTNNKLRAVRNYYDYLKEQHPGIKNPAVNLKVRGVRKKIPSGIINYDELEELYKNFPNKTNRDKRNRIILGLLIYQAITTEELHRLEPSHLKLKEGKIIIPGNRKRNGRTLDLKPSQILELHEYLEKVRPTIIKEISEPKPARKPNKINEKRLNDQLFISINGSCDLKNTLLHLFKSVRKIKPEITNAKQIRASTITFWLRHNNLRQVQYMAGHRWVSSTERYQVDKLENLQKKLEECHPLK